jgi:hypothetical protein
MCCLELGRANATEMTVTTRRFIQAVDVVGHIHGREPAIRIDSLFDPLLLQAAEEGFSDSIVPAISSPAHARLEVIRFTEASPSITPVLGWSEWIKALRARRRQTAFATASRANPGCPGRYRGPSGRRQGKKSVCSETPIGQANADSSYPLALNTISQLSAMAVNPGRHATSSTSVVVVLSTYAST